MNRKEANKIIEKHSVAFGALPREAIEAIEYLINAEPCEDAISREEAIEAIARVDCTDGTKAIFCGRYIVGLLKELPSVTPKQKMCFDGMTNGEVIGLLFQNTDIYHTYHNHNFMLRELVFTDEWWDAPYTAESEGAE